jgi:hypothetical protein
VDKIMIKKILILISIPLLGLITLAATKITLLQIALPSSAPGTPYLLVNVGGNWNTVQLGDGIILYPTIGAGAAGAPYTITTTTIQNTVAGETPTITGSTLALAHTPLLLSEQVYDNGLRQLRGIDYTITGNIITFSSPPQPGDTMQVDYKY